MSSPSPSPPSFRRVRFRRAALAIAVSMVVWAPSASAQPAGSTEGGQAAAAPTTVSTTATTTSPTTSPTTASTGGPSTTQGSDGVTVTTVAGGDQPPPPTNPDGSPMVTEPGDRGAGEEPDEVPPVVDLTVPPRSDGGDADQWDPGVERVLVSNVADARKKVAAAERAHNEAIALVKVLRLREKSLAAEREALDARTQQTLAELEAARTRLRERALRAFVAGGNDGLEAALDTSLDAEAALELEAQKAMVETVFATDEEVIGEYERARRALDVQTLGLFDRMALVAESMAPATADVETKAAAVEQAKRELEAFEAGSQIYVHGVVFPIQWPYEVPLIDSWGFPRSEGRRHQGIDIFAPSGTPLLATERGIVTRIGSGRLGGLRLWLRGASGTDWYYAHLSGFAPRLTEGKVVEVGDVLGYVGTTGNAVGTPPHLHLQVHPNGGDPVNPYPLLAVVSARERADRERGPAEGADD